MKKLYFLKRVSGEAGLVNQAADAAVGAVLACIAEALARGQKQRPPRAFASVGRRAPS